MNSDKALKIQIEKLKTRQEKRLKALDDEVHENIRHILNRRLAVPLIILIAAIAVVLTIVGLVGSPLIVLGIILLGSIVYIVCHFYRMRAEKVLLDELDDKKEIYKASLRDLDLTLDIANDAASTKRNFLAGVSHDIRTPINAILGIDSMIIRDSKDPVITGYAKEIKQAGNILMAYVSDLLDTTRLETGTFEILNMDYDLCSVINDVYNLYLRTANAKGVKLDLKVDEDTPHELYGDGLRIKQCILKLLDNAVKFTEEGTVTVDIGYTKIGQDEILLAVSISDTGMGIKEEEIETLLMPFEKASQDRSVKNEGCGLGISIVNGLLKLMNTQLRVESVFGVGSTFSFSVSQKVINWKPIGRFERLYEDEPADIEISKAEEEEEKSFRAPDAKVLVVDDSSVNLMIAEGLLKEYGMRISLVDSGGAAIEACRKEVYDLILLDHMMPEMDGVETLHNIRKDEKSLNGTTKIVALTANAVEGARERYEELGFDYYLSKPIVIEKLRDTLKMFLRPELIVYKGEDEEALEEAPVTEENPFISKMKTIKGVFVEKGLENSGSPELYEKVTGEFAETGMTRAATIEEYFESEDIKNYTIQVHALKSAARIIGALPLSMLAAALEEAGNEGNLVKIKNATGELLKLYRELVTNLEQILDSRDDKPEIDEASLKDAVMSLREVVDGFDFDSADSIMAELKKYKMPESFNEKYIKLKTLVAEVARDDILLLLETF